MPNGRATILMPVAIVALMSLCLWVGGCAGGERIHSSGSKEFTKGPPTRISRTEAYALMRQDPKFEERPRTWGFKKDAGLMVGRWYAFVDYDKWYRSFEGYYVNADTGEVQFRTSDKKIWEGKSENRSRAYPTDWTSIEQVKPPAYPSPAE